uniref:Uncharacterized protein n=1 Tax=Clytia hemisphaerica TaxID=252671 RepID=A0A7M5WRQ3_9CNID
MLGSSRCQSMDNLSFETEDEETEPIGTETGERKRSCSLESGLESIDDVRRSSYVLLKDEKDFVISDLKYQCQEKDKEISRLKSVDINYGQAKQQLKDIKWMLKVKEDELRNIRADCAANYNKRIEEITLRLNEKDVKLTALIEENQTLNENMKNLPQQVKELSEQVEYLKEDNQSKSEEISFLEKKLLESNEEKNDIVTSLSNSNIQSELKIEEGNENLKDLQNQITSLQTQIETLESDKLNLLETVLQKENEKQLLQEQNSSDKLYMENELQREKQNVADLMALLEGVSTNSDQLPTGQVYQTMNTPLDSYLLKRTTSNDSVHEMEDLQSDQENVANRSEASESGNASFREQMNHTIGKYENQIKELQILYDQDVETLEEENKEMKEQIKNLRRQLKSSDSSNKIADLNVEEVENTYKRKMSDARKEHKQALQLTQREAEDNVTALLAENDKLNKLLSTTEEKYTTIIENIRQEFMSMSNHQVDYKINDVLESQQTVVSKINLQMKEELEKINQKYNEELLEIELKERENASAIKTNLEESFSDQMVNMHENQRDLESQITRLDGELDSVQTEYNALKHRYDDVIKKLDNVQFENQRLQDILDSKQQDSLQLPGNSGNHHRDSDVLSISSNDVEIASEKYVNIDYQTSPGHSEPTMSEQLKLLRENLNDAKNDVHSLREEKMRFEVLSENLNQELNTLKSELQNQSIFDMSKNQPIDQSTMRFLEASVHDLLSASGFILPEVEQSVLDESMLPSQYLHGNAGDKKVEHSDDEEDSLEENTMFHDSIILGPGEGEEVLAEHFNFDESDLSQIPLEAEEETFPGTPENFDENIKNESVNQEEDITQNPLGDSVNFQTPKRSEGRNNRYQNQRQSFNFSQMPMEGDSIRLETPIRSKVKRISSSNASQTPFEGDSVYLETPDRTKENEEAQRLFQKIKYIVDATRDEQNIICNQLNYLKTKFSGILNNTGYNDTGYVAEDVEENTQHPMEWKDLAQGLLNQKTKVHEENSTTPSTATNTFEAIQGNMVELAEQMFTSIQSSSTKVVGKPREVQGIPIIRVESATQFDNNESSNEDGQFHEGETKHQENVTTRQQQYQNQNYDEDLSTKVETSTQCDLAEFPDPQFIIEEIQTGYKENLDLVKQQMDTSNKESLALLKMEMEKDHNNLMEMLQESLNNAHEENVLSLTKAHEEEIATVEKELHERINNLERELTELRNQEAPRIDSTDALPVESLPRDYFAGSTDIAARSSDDMLRYQDSYMAVTHPKESLSRKELISEYEDKMRDLEETWKQKNLDDLAELHSNLVIKFEQQRLKDSIKSPSKDAEILEEQIIEPLNESVQNTIPFEIEEVIEAETMNVQNESPDYFVGEIPGFNTEEPGKPLESGELDTDDATNFASKVIEAESKATDRIKEHNIEVLKLQETLQELRQVNDELKSEMQNLEKVQIKKDGRFTDIETQIKDLEGANVELKNELDRKSGEYERAEEMKGQELASLSRSYDENSQRLNEIFLEHQQLQDTNKKLQGNVKQYQDLEPVLQERFNEITTLSESLDASKSENQELIEKNKQLLDDLVQKDDIQKQQEEKLKAQEIQLANLAQEVEKKCLEYQHLIDERDSVQQRNKELEELIGSKQNEGELLAMKDKDIAVLNQEVDTKTKEFKELVAERVELQKRNNYLEYLIVQKQDEIEDIVAEKESECTLLNVTLDESRGKLTALELQCQNLLEQNETLQSQVKEESQENKDHLEVLESQCHALRQENEKLQDVLSKHSEDSQALEEQILVLETAKEKADTTQEELEGLESKYQTLQEENSHLQDALQKLRNDSQSKLDILDSGYKILKEQNLNLEGVVANQANESKEKIATLESQCQYLETENKNLQEMLVKKSEDFEEQLSARDNEIAILNQSIEETTSGLVKLKEENLKLLTDAQELESNLGKKSEEMIAKEAEMTESAMSKENLLSTLQNENRALKSLVDEKEMLIQNHQGELEKYQESLENLNGFVLHHQKEKQELEQRVKEIENQNSEKDKAYKDGINVLVQQFSSKLPKNEEGDPINIDELHTEHFEPSSSFDPSLHQLQTVFQTFHDQEIEELKRSSFQWLKTKMAENDQKLQDQEASWKQKNLDDLAELHSSLVIKFEQQRLQESLKSPIKSDNILNKDASCQTEVSSAANIDNNFQSNELDGSNFIEPPKEVTLQSEHMIEPTLVQDQNTTPPLVYEEPLISIEETSELNQSRENDFLENMAQPVVTARQVLPEQEVTSSDTNTPHPVTITTDNIIVSQTLPNQQLISLDSHAARPHLPDQEDAKIQELQSEVNNLQNTIEKLNQRESELSKEIISLKRTDSPSKPRVSLKTRTLQK